MIFDLENLLSNNQAITAAAISENVIDLGLADRDIGVGEQLYIFGTVVTAFTDSGSDSTLAVTLETDDNVGLTSAAVLQTLVTLPALTAVGTKFLVPIAPEVLNAFQQYIGLRYTPSGGNLSTGAIFAGIVAQGQLEKVKASGYTVPAGF